MCIRDSGSAVPLWNTWLDGMQEEAPEGHGAAAVEGHHGHGRVVQHGLDAAVGRRHRLGDGLRDLEMCIRDRLYQVPDSQGERTE